MKLAIITCSRYPPTLGSGARPIRLFEAISKKHEIHIFYVGQSWITTNRNFRDGTFLIHTVKLPLINIPKIGFFSYKLSGDYFVRRIKEFDDFNAIYLDSPTIWASLALKASKKLSIPLFTDYPDLEVYEHDSGIAHKIYKIITVNTMKDVFSNSKHIFPMCHLLRNRLIDFYKVSADKITIIPNGVDTGMFDPATKSGLKMRERFGLSNSIIIGFSGALERWVKIDVLLKAFKKVGEDYKDVKLLIVGKGSELTRWKQLSKDLGIENDVIFTGLVPYKEIPEYIASFDIAVSIFSKSLFTDVVSPLKVIEYMSMGKAVVADNLSGTREFIKNEENGILFESEDTKSLENAIRMILDDEKLKRKIERNARKTAMKYDWKVLSKKLGDVLISKLEGEDYAQK